MRVFMFFLVAITLLTSSVLAEENAKVAEGKVTYKSARLEVKQFIYDHADLYENFEVKYIGGADPELVFVKSDDSEERIPVDTMTTEEICKVVEERGFEKRSKPEVPPVPGEGEEDEEEEGSGFLGPDEDHPGLDIEDELELEAFRDGRIPAAPGNEDDIHRPAPLTPEEREEL